MGIEQHLVVGIDEVDETQAALVGGKGAQLGALSSVDGIEVPPGFCLTTAAFRRVLARAPGIGGRLDALSLLDADDRDAIRRISAEVREALQRAGIPDGLRAEIAGALAQLDDEAIYAVRSSATAEDIPSASFAGQHDSYMNIAGLDAVLEHVRRCWASLFTERAVTYRAAQRRRPAQRPRWRWSCSGWSPRRPPASCSPPTR